MQSLCTTAVFLWVRPAASAPHHLQPQPHLHNTTSHLQRHAHHTSDRVTQINSHNKTTHGKRHVNGKKTSALRDLTNILTQVVLGDDDDDDYDSSSSSDSHSAVDSTSHSSTERPKLSQWNDVDVTMNKKSSRDQIKKDLEIRTTLPFKAEKMNEKQTNNSLQTTEEPMKKLSLDKIDKPQKIQNKTKESMRMKDKVHKMAARVEDFNLFERVITVAEKIFSFIESSALLEIVALAVVASRIFRSAAVPSTTPALSVV